eukprot:1141752-Rhodomonas_salina.1
MHQVAVCVGLGTLRTIFCERGFFAQLAGASSRLRTNVQGAGWLLRKRHDRHDVATAGVDGNMQDNLRPRREDEQSVHSGPECGRLRATRREQPKFKHQLGDSMRRGLETRRSQAL